MKIAEVLTTVGLLHARNPPGLTAEQRDDSRQPSTTCRISTTVILLDAVIK
jgi:hypothetical protein